MRIGIICEYYPASYRPGFDTEFAQFIRDGHEIEIYSTGGMGAADTEVIAKFRLAEKTKNFPATARGVPRYVGTVLKGIVTRPGFAFRAARLAMGVEGKLKEKITEWVRMFTLPVDPPDMWYYHSLTVAKAFTWLGELYPGTPVALYFHGSEVPKYMRKMPASLTTAVWQQCTIVFTNTPFFVGEVERQGCPREKIQVVPGGFDLERFPFDDARVYRPDGLLRLVSAGRLSEEKGMAFSLKAVHDLIAGGMTNIRYTIVGHGHLKASLEQYVRDNGLTEYVSFTGQLSSTELFNQLRAADALILPSIRFEGFIENQARILQEAMLCQTLVITSDDGGIRDSIPDIMRQFAVPPEDSAAIGRAIAALAAYSPEQLDDMGRACRQWVIDNYEIKYVNDQLLTRTFARARQLGGMKVPG